MERHKNRKAPIVWVVITAMLLSIALYTTGVSIAQEQKVALENKVYVPEKQYVENADIIQWQWALVCVCFGAAVSLVVYIFHTGQNGTRQLIADLKDSTEKGFLEVKKEMHTLSQDKLDVSVHHDCPNFARIQAMINRS